MTDSDLVVPMTAMFEDEPFGYSLSDDGVQLLHQLQEENRLLREQNGQLKKVEFFWKKATAIAGVFAVVAAIVGPIAAVLIAASIS